MKKKMLAFQWDNLGKIYGHKNILKLNFKERGKPIELHTSNETVTYKQVIPTPPLIFFTRHKNMNLTVAYTQ